MGFTRQRVERKGEDALLQVGGSEGRDKQFVEFEPGGPR